VTFRAAISWYPVDPITIPNCRIADSDNVDILGNHVHPTAQMLFSKFLGNNIWSVECSFFKKTIRPCTQSEMFSLGLKSMKIHFNIFRGQHKSPDLNIS